ncbi:MAG: NAD(P)H-hydrate dehydratase [Pseudomonadota bacterium]
MSDFILLSVEQMKAAEAAAINSGLSGAALMESAGKGAAAVITRAFDKRPTTVLCGPGANGGDGYVIARLLKAAGWEVRVAALGKVEDLSGDAKLMADLYEGPIEPLSPSALQGAGLIIDSLFGTGLSRPLDGPALETVNAVNGHPAPAIAIDLPSGVNANSGEVMGAAIQAARTVTFFRKKPGHVLFPGRALCGALDIVDIGITPEVAQGVPVNTAENQPGLWANQFRRPTFQTHKYHRGHVFVVSGDTPYSGAARLSARASLRIGAGLVTILSPENAVDVHAAHLSAIMIRKLSAGQDIGSALARKDQYKEVFVVGPGLGVSNQTRDTVKAALQSSADVVLDADALSSFSDKRQTLLDQLRPNDILTPHSGEFLRLFGDVDTDRLASARVAAKRAGCVVVLKGADTIIARPDGLTAINTNAPPDLATAGSGDVLAGLVAGLLAQGMPAFEAACAGVWFHGAAAQILGPGLTADDLPRALPNVLRSLLNPPQTKQARQQLNPV